MNTYKQRTTNGPGTLLPILPAAALLVMPLSGQEQWWQFTELEKNVDALMEAADVVGGQPAEPDDGLDDDPTALEKDAAILLESTEAAVEGSETKAYGFEGERDWFYDYWNGGFIAYHDKDADGIIDYADQFYDYNGDGFQDAVHTLVDWDQNGLFEDVTYRTFGLVSAADRKASRKSVLRDSEIKTVQGEIERAKRVSMRGDVHLVTQVRANNGVDYVVDLGPASKLAGLGLEDGGDTVTVQGPLASLGSRTILIAEKLATEDLTMSLERQRGTVTGRVVDTRTTKVSGHDQLMAKVAVDGERRILIDLGPLEPNTMEVNSGSRLTVRGTAVKVGGRSLLLAQEAGVGDKNLTRISRYGKRDYRLKTPKRNRSQSQ